MKEKNTTNDSKKKSTIGIMGAMIEEVALLKKAMTITNTKKFGNREYYCGQLYDTKIVLVFSRWGKVAASSTATTLINIFGVNTVIFTGVAGAIQKKLNIGDIVIGSSSYQHDMDARPFFQQFQIPLTNTIMFKSNSELAEKAKKAAKKFFSNITSDIKQTLLKKFSIFSPNIYDGIIASGDQFVSDTTSKNLNIDGEEVLAVEMEGAAVAQVLR